MPNRLPQVEESLGLVVILSTIWLFWSAWKTGLVLSQNRSQFFNITLKKPPTRGDKIARVFALAISFSTFLITYGYIASTLHMGSTTSHVIFGLIVGSAAFLMALYNILLAIWVGSGFRFSP
jgi:hypothetical protein